MKVNLETGRPYFPYLLSNGEDVVLLNYSGAMVCGVTTHTHNEQNQACSCGWYKESHRRYVDRLLPIVLSGYQIEIGGEICEPIDSEQEYDCRRGILTTEATFRRGVRIRVEAYLTDMGVLACEFTVLKDTDGLGLAFLLLSPNMVAGTLTFHVCPKITFADGPKGLDFEYGMGSMKGHGVLRASAGGWTVKEYCGREGLGLRYDVSEGWHGAMVVSCADEPARPCEEYAGLRARHEAAHLDYFGASDVQLPDPWLQYAYEVSRLVLKGTVHPTGAMPCGQLPNQWNGGTCVPWDSSLMQDAMLQGGNFKEGSRHLDFYLERFEEGCRLAEDIGLSGFAFSNWSDVFGNHLGRDLKYELSKRKPLMIAVIGIVAANCLRYGCSIHEDRTHSLMRSCATFIEKGFIRNGKLVSCIAGNESFVEVERDSLMLSICWRLFNDMAELDNDGHCAILANAMRRELEANRREDGVIMPYAQADYTAGESPLIHYYVPDAFTSAPPLEAALAPQVTRWDGLDNDQPSESYRHWPWNDCLYAMSFAKVKAPKRAFHYLRRWFDYAASSGASPEKIRLDGYVIGYWFQTSYAYYLLALYASFAYVAPSGVLQLLYGFDGTWRDLAIKGQRLPGGLEVSLNVEKGVLEICRIANHSSSEKRLKLDMNPIYGRLETTDIILPPQREICIKGKEA